MPLKMPTKESYCLLHEGALLFAGMERRGLHIDVPYLDKAIVDTQAEIRRMYEQMQLDPIWATWQKTCGTDMNPNSHEQLGRVIFDVLGNKRNPHAVTKNKKKERELGEDYETEYANNERAFKHLSIPFVSLWFEQRKLDKAVGTFLQGIKKEVVDGVLHPFYDLHTAESYRPSSSRPNFANQPRRNKRIAKIVRTCVVPRPGFVFIPADYSGNEVRESINYHHDPIFEKYVLGGGDMHRDVAKDIFLLSDKEIGEPKSETEAVFRDCSKNKCVFPGFYGATYVTIAPDVWAYADEFKLKTAQGVPIFEHLKRKGIKSLGLCAYQDSNGQPRKPTAGTLEYVVWKAQEAFWERFSVYDQWKRDWWEAYQQNGGFNSLSGFCYRGIFRRNQVLCDAIQGSAFHRMLWAMIQVNKIMIQKKMKSRFILQVYDDAVCEVHESEIDDYCELYERYATVEVRKHWPWIVVPLKVDFNICRTSWADKQELKR